MRFAVIGLGNLGSRRARLLGDRCLTTVDPYNPAAHHTSLDDLDPKGFDAVVLAVPNQAKLALLRRLLEWGKHTLVEKPLFFPDDAAAFELETLARARGAVWYTAYNHRFEPHVIRMKELLAAGAIGDIYFGRMVYGNGTVQNAIGTWRDDGYGVLADLGCHLIDLVGYLFGYHGTDFVPWTLDSVEARCFDRCVLAAAGRRFELACSTLMWKNTFTIDVYGRLGSLHMDGLCKWGPTSLTVRRRMLPSGTPHEERQILRQPDQTWGADLQEFLHTIAAGQTTCENDLRITRAVHAVAGYRGETALPRKPVMGV